MTTTAPEPLTADEAADWRVTRITLVALVHRFAISEALEVGEWGEGTTLAKVYDAPGTLALERLVGRLEMVAEHGMEMSAEFPSPLAGVQLVTTDRRVLVVPHVTEGRTRNVQGVSVAADPASYPATEDGLRAFAADVTEAVLTVVRREAATPVGATA